MPGLASPGRVRPRLAEDSSYRHEPSGGLGNYGDHCTSPRKLTRHLEAIADAPPEVIWDEKERRAWTRAEFYHDGRYYQPARREGKDPRHLVTIPADVLVASPSVLQPLWEAGKIDCGPPYGSIGRTRESGELVIVPWGQSTSSTPLSTTTAGESFDSTLVHVRLLKLITVLNGVSLKVGDTFYLPFAYAQGIGFYTTPRLLELLQP